MTLIPILFDAKYFFSNVLSTSFKEKNIRFQNPQAILLRRQINFSVKCDDRSELILIIKMDKIQTQKEEIMDQQKKTKTLNQEKQVKTFSFFLSWKRIFP